MDEQIWKDFHNKLRLVILPLIENYSKDCTEAVAINCFKVIHSFLNATNNIVYTGDMEITSSDERLVSRRKDGDRPSVQGSTSLPTLNKEESGSQLRETSSWSEGSRPRQTPSQTKKVHFCAIQQEIPVGDHLDATHETENDDDKSFCENDQLKDDEVLNTIEEINKGQCEKDGTSTEVFKNHLYSSSSHVSKQELEKQFDTIMNSAFCSLSQTPGSTRKKWQNKADAYWQLERRFKRLEREEDDFEDETSPSLSNRQESRERIFDTSPYEFASFGSRPTSRNVTESDIGERLEKAVLKVLKELKEVIHTLCAFRLEFDDHLTEIKQARLGRDRREIVPRPPTPPKKKSSEFGPDYQKIRCRSRENETEVGKDGHSLEEDFNRKSEKRMKSTEFGEDKNTGHEKSGRFSNYKESSDTKKTQDTSELGEEDYLKKSDKEVRSVEQYRQIEANSSCSFDVLSNAEKRDAKEENNEIRNDNRNTESYKRSECNSKIQHPEFEKEPKDSNNCNDSDIKSHMTSECKSEKYQSKIVDAPKENRLNRSGNKRTYKYPDNQQKYQEYEYFPRFYYPCQAKHSNVGNSSYAPSTNRSPRRGHRNPRSNQGGFRRGQSASWQRSSSTNCLEGGDVLQTTNFTQRSVSTDTESLETRQHTRNSNDSRKDAQVSPLKGRKTRDHTNCERRRDFGRESGRNEAFNNTSNSEYVGDSRNTQKKWKNSKGNDSSFKPSDLPTDSVKRSEHDVVAPIRNSTKNEPKPDFPIQNSGKQQPKTDNSLKNYKEKHPDSDTHSDLLQNSKKHDSSSSLQISEEHNNKSDSSVQQSKKQESKHDSPLQSSKKPDSRPDLSVQDSNKSKPKPDSLLQNFEKQEPNPNKLFQNYGENDPNADSSVSNSKKPELEPNSLLQNSGKQDTQHEQESKNGPQLQDSKKMETKPGLPIINSGKPVSKCSENCELGRDGFELRRAVSNSSLNPSAKSFQPSIFFKAIEKAESPKHKNEQKLERRNFVNTEDMLQSRNSELSDKRNSGKRIDWTIENSENYTRSEESETSAPHRGNGYLGTKNGVASQGLTSTPKPQRETFTPYNPLNGATHQPETGHGSRKRTNDTHGSDQKTENGINGAKAPHHGTNWEGNGAARTTEDNQRRGTSLQQKSRPNMACVTSAGGDVDTTRVLNDRQRNQLANVTSEAGNSQRGRNPDVCPQKEEPGLDSACGDIVVAADGGRSQPFQVQQQGVMNASRGEPINPDGNVGRGLEEIWSNYASDSENESSIVDSSEMSEMSEDQRD